MLFADGAILEAKTAQALVPAHRNQTLTYLFLTGLNHARLVNLRPEKVEYELVSTKLTHRTRKEFSISDRNWEKVNMESAWLKAKVCELLDDWGAFLDVALYREAITHFLGGAEKVTKPVGVFHEEAEFASQRMHLLTDDTAFAFSAVTGAKGHVRDHQLRLLRQVRLRHIQWVNFNRHEIEFETLSKL